MRRPAFTLIDHITESNRIEHTPHLEPLAAEIEEAKRFLNLTAIDIGDLMQFVSVYAPSHRLRDRVGLNVRVGRHLPPAGAPGIKNKLQKILDEMAQESPYITHHKYETLHPFTDGNGRSGRILWLWAMGGVNNAPLGFLHHFYYQSLEEGR